MMEHGCVCAAIPIATAKITKFLMMYWPSMVGTKKDCHAIAGNVNSGITVVIMCKNNNGIAIRINFGNKNKTPMNTSNNPNKI